MTTKADEVIRLLRDVNPVRALGKGSTFDATYEGEDRIFTMVRGAQARAFWVCGRPWIVVR